MPETSPDPSLHLPSLVIKNFRGIDELTIPRLGRVTLLAGKNGVGKTTVLDAVSIYAARGKFQVLDDVLTERGDALIATDPKGGHTLIPDVFALFTDRRNSPEIEISIGAIPKADVLHIGWEASVNLRSDQPTMPRPDEFATTGRPTIIVRLGDSKIYSAHTGYVVSSPPTIVCNSLGPNGPSDDTVEGYWSEVALTSDEDLALEALNLITAAQVERVAALGSPTGNGVTQPRRMMAKVTGKDYQVPLRTLGDGALRTYAVALALAISSGGFLLIDEVENGIHHSVQAKFWRMILQTAHRNNVQVIATTHSWDCVKGFAEASSELEDVEGVLVRLERHEGRLRAVEYSERNLKAAAKYGIEVR